MKYRTAAYVCVAVLETSVVGAVVVGRTGVWNREEQGCVEWRATSLEEKLH